MPQTPTPCCLASRNLCIHLWRTRTCRAKNVKGTWAASTLWNYWHKSWILVKGVQNLRSGVSSWAPWLECMILGQELGLVALERPHPQSVDPEQFSLKPRNQGSAHQTNEASFLSGQYHWLNTGSAEGQVVETDWNSNTDKVAVSDADSVTIDCGNEPERWIVCVWKPHGVDFVFWVFVSTGQENHAEAITDCFAPPQQVLAKFADFWHHCRRFLSWGSKSWSTEAFYRKS